MKTLSFVLLFFFIFIPLLSKSQSTAIEWYERGIEETNHTEKIKFFDNAIREDENYADAYFQKGLAFFQLLKIKEALSQYNIALQISRKKEYFEARGIAFYELKNYNQALTDFNEALQSSPQNRKILIRKASTLNELSRYDEALTAYNEVLKVEPLNTEALLGKGKTFIGIGKTNEAQKLINELLLREPSNQEALLILGRSYELISDTTRAITLYTKVLSLNKKHLKANEALVRIRIDNETQQPCTSCPIVATTSTTSPPLPLLSSFKRKFALSIGNSKYLKFPSLQNKPINDANAISSRLATFGFQTKTLSDTPLKEFENALTDFCNQVENADVVFFFYAGHGVEKAGLNYFVPTDAETAKDVTKFVQLQEILERLQSKNVKYVVIVADACRSDVANLERGLTPIDNSPVNKVQISPKIPSNYFIGYATLSGKPAQNGVSENGVYTAAILKTFKKGTRLDDAFRNARMEVLHMTGNAQLPENTEGMSQPFIFD